jgi:Sporulation and spore germination
MSERIDRRINGSRSLIWLLVAISAVIAVAGGAVWLRLNAPDPQQNQAAQAPSSRAQPVRADEPLAITLYYPADGAIATGTASVKRRPDSQAQAREALGAVFADHRVLQAAVFRDLKIRELFLDASGTAYVDLSPVQQNGIKASAWEELLAIYSMVNTLAQNFEEIKQVHFLLEGKEAQTLAGHMDLSRKFEKRMDLMKQ